jgi:coenzyme F420 hydrogenase subunit beta
MSLDHKIVCEVIVKSDLCIGCGVCAGICPPKVLEMRFNKFGEYIPIEVRQGCLPKCNLCLKSCPFYDNTVNEDDLSTRAFSDEEHVRHKTETGYYLESFAGYSLSHEHRLNSASGGLTTWFLQALLENELADKVICVTPHNELDKLYHFTIIEDPNDIQKSAKSCYYPIEMSEVIKEVLNFDARYAVVGLPCFLKSIRQASLTNRRLRARIKWLVGLVCGQNKSKLFAEYLCSLGGGDPTFMYRAEFRKKDLTKPANNFGFHFECSEGEIKNGDIFWLEGMREAWTRGYFKPNACNYCDDVFAELADVVFMDAWLDRYISEPMGTNIVLVRKASIFDIFKKGQNQGSIHLENISIEDAIESQRGVIDVKHKLLAQRLTLAKKLNWKNIPTKRISSGNPSLLELSQRWLDYRITQISKRAFLVNKSHKGLLYFRLIISPILFLKYITVRFQSALIRLGLFNQ